MEEEALVEQRGNQQHGEDGERGGKFPEHDRGVAHRRGHQQLDGAALFLLGVDAHGEHRHQEQRERAEHREEVLDDQAGDVDIRCAAELGGLEPHLHRPLDHESEDAVEEEAGDAEEDTANDVGDR